MTCLLTGYVDINMIRHMSRGGEVPYATTLLVRDCCLCLHVQRAARALGRRFDDALRPFGLTNGQFSLLMSLNRPQPAGIAVIELAPKRSVDKQKVDHTPFTMLVASAARRFRPTFRPS